MNQMMGNTNQIKISSHWWAALLLETINSKIANILLNSITDLSSATHSFNQLATRVRSQPSKLLAFSRFSDLQIAEQLLSSLTK